MRVGLEEGVRHIISIPQRRIVKPKERCVARSRARTGIRAFGHSHPVDPLQAFFPGKARPPFTLALPTKDWDPPSWLLFPGHCPFSLGPLLASVHNFSLLPSPAGPLKKVTVSDPRESEGATKTFLNQLGGQAPRRRKCVMRSHNPTLLCRRCDFGHL